MVDLKYNSVPEVNVVDQRNQVEHRMSWHHIHELSSRIMTQAIFTPRVSCLLYISPPIIDFIMPQAFTIRSRSKGNKAKGTLSWEYRLLSVMVIGEVCVDYVIFLFPASNLIC
jgi:hypothetical protein